MATPIQRETTQIEISQVQTNQLKRMRRAFGFQQQSYGMRQEAQQQSHLMHQEAAWHSKDDYHGLEIGLQTVPSLCLDSQLMKHTSLFDGNQVLQFHNSSWDDHILNQNEWSSSGTNGTFYNHPSGAIKLLPVMDVTNTADFSRGAMFNKSMENAEYRTRFHEEMHVPATVRVHGMRYESSVWGDHDILQYRRHPLYDGGSLKRSGCWRSEWM